MSWSISASGTRAFVIEKIGLDAEHFIETDLMAVDQRWALYEVLNTMPGTHIHLNASGHNSIDTPAQHCSMSISISSYVVRPEDAVSESPTAIPVS